MSRRIERKRIFFIPESQFSICDSFLLLARGRLLLKDFQKYKNRRQV